jgi:Fe-S-cluster-containing hydrogenase component 2
MQEKEGHIAVIGCRKCLRCNNICPYGALHRIGGFAKVDSTKCTLCMECVKVCPNKALIYID